MSWHPGCFDEVYAQHGSVVGGGVSSHNVQIIDILGVV